MHTNLLALEAGSHLSMTGFASHVEYYLAAVGSNVEQLTQVGKSNHSAVKSLPSQIPLLQLIPVWEEDSAQQKLFTVPRTRDN